MKSFRSVRLGKRPYRQERRVRTNGPESIHSSVPFWKTPGKTCLPTIAGTTQSTIAGASGYRGGNSGHRAGAANPILSPFRSQKQKKAGGFRRLLPGIAIIPIQCYPIPCTPIAKTSASLQPHPLHLNYDVIFRFEDVVADQNSVNLRAVNRYALNAVLAAVRIINGYI